MACVVTPVQVPRLSTIPNSHDYEQWSGKGRRDSRLGSARD
jgi:hypothetical protein